MDPFEVYKTYLALGGHFDTERNYDFIKYNGKTNVTYKAFQKRNDAHHFVKMSKIPNAKLRMICSFVEEIGWISEMVGDQGREAQMKHQKYMDAAAYYFKDELQRLPKPISQMVAYKNGGPLPPIIQLYFQKILSLETLVILNNLINYLAVWKSSSTLDPLLLKVVNKIEKFTPFFVYEKDKIRAVFVDYCSKNQ